MRKTALALGLSILLLVTTACQNEAAKEDRTKQTQPVEQLSIQNKSEEEAISEEEAKKLVKSAMDTIRTTLQDFANQYDWGYNRNLQPDLAIIKEALLPIATETYIDTNTDFFNKFYRYIETCAVLFPNVNTDVRFFMEQQKDTLHIETLELAGELIDGGKWTFDFQYEDNTWKLDKWSSFEDVQLTQAEANKIINRFDEEDKYVFVQEVNRDGYKQYEFKQKDEGSTACVNAATTYVTYINDIVSQSETESEAVEEEQEEVAVVETSLIKSDDIVGNFKRSSKPPSTGLDTKLYYLNYLAEIDNYNTEIYDGDGSGTSTAPYTVAWYKLNDAALNEIWGVLRNNLDPAIFETLKAEQLQWIKEKEATMKEEEQGLYNWHIVNSYGTGAQLTIQRCKELLNTYFY